MAANRNELQRSIRVVVFGGGPVLERGVKQLICRLEEHLEIEFLAVFCQSQGQTFWAVVVDLWRRRRFLAFPLLLVQLANGISRFMMQPRTEIKKSRKLARLSDRLHLVPDIHSEDVLERVRSLAPDLGLIYGSPILKPVLFEIPTFGTLGIHHGKVPEYRGKKTTFWAIFNDEKVAGVTIQKVNAGLDTGQIVKQGAVPIGCRPQRAVWHELEALGLDLYIQAIIEVKQGTANYQPQAGKRGKLYRDPKLADIATLWWKRFKKCMPRSFRAQQGSSTRHSQ